MARLPLGETRLPLREPKLHVTASKRRKYRRRRLRTASFGGCPFSGGPVWLEMGLIIVESAGARTLFKVLFCGKFN